MSFTYTFAWWHLIPALLVLGGLWLYSQEDWSTETYGFRLPVLGLGGCLLWLLAAMFFVGRCAG